MTTAKQPDPPPRWEITSGPIKLSVRHSANVDKTWQWLSLDFGYHSENSMAECMQTWPREAIAKARAKLDEFEEFLDNNK